MAKKKTEESAAPEDFLGRLYREINDEFGEGILSGGCDIVDKEQKILPVSPALDAVLGGGILEGTIAIFSGKFKCGKSSAALKFCANAQKSENGSRHIFYGDVEMRLEKRNLVGTYGLDYSPEKFTHIKSTKGQILTAEKHLSIYERIINNCPNSILVIDSLSALCNEKEYTDDLTGQARPGGPKLVAAFLRRISNSIKINNVTVIVMLHLITNISGYGATYVEDGGIKIQFFLSNKLRAKSVEDWTVGSGANEQKIGQITTWSMECSALNGVPGTTCQTYLRYGYGLDDHMENIQLAINLGLIEKKASWFAFNGQSIQGIDGLYKYLKENQELYLELEKNIRGLLYG